MGQSKPHQIDWYQRNRERILAERKEAYEGLDEEALADLKAQAVMRNRRYRYGLSPEGYRAMLEEHGYICAICSMPHLEDRPLQVDHDHITEQRRGLLCRRCNIVLGWVKDDIDLLEAAISYLRTRGAAL